MKDDSWSLNECICIDATGKMLTLNWLVNCDGWIQCYGWCWILKKKKSQEKNQFKSSSSRRWGLSLTLSTLPSAKWKFAQQRLIFPSHIIECITNNRWKHLYYTLKHLTTPFIRSKCSLFLILKKKAANLFHSRCRAHSFHRRFVCHSSTNHSLTHFFLGSLFVPLEMKTLWRCTQQLFSIFTTFSKMVNSTATIKCFTIHTENLGRTWWRWMASLLARNRK